jgi:transcriptional regulator with XRE-family HTH domain
VVKAMFLHCYNYLSKENKQLTSAELKMRRKLRGLTQAEAAERMGISQPTYSLIETGKKDLNEYSVQLKTAGFLDDVEVSWTKPEIGTLSTTHTPPLTPTTIAIQTKPAPEKAFNTAPYKNVGIGGSVRRKDVVGVVKGYEHSGVPRFVVHTGGKAMGMYVWPVEECEIVELSA